MMIERLSLRIRVFLFFCLAALGSLGILFLALWIGYRQLGDPAAASAFITAAIIGAFGISGLIIFIWLLFDDNVSKPIERIAAGLRVRAHVDMSTPIDVTSAKYLGDLAPAASALGAFLDKTMRSRSEISDHLVQQLQTQRDQLVKILSDIPIATILASADHQIVLYDGQAAALMERVGTARLKTSVFDYFEKESILTALDQIESHDVRRTGITVKSLCDTHYSGHIRVFGKDAGYTLMLEPLALSEARPLTFDFDLLSASKAQNLHDTPLGEMVFVVFDSETTGLIPATDHVVQLGAVRVVNGKIVTTEAFDTLVNPGVPIPARSTDVHGISTAMVAQAPAFDEVCLRFHSFASGSVMVAHNAAFDMAFLHQQAPKINRVFDHPVVDTVLMSAAIFGGSAVHTLDAICDRLCITIPEDQRHTAMGDAVATAKALVAMIPIFQARGIETYGALRAELEKHRRALKS